MIANTGNSSQIKEFAPWRDKTAQPLIRFENVSKHFGDFVAIENLSLDIYEREFFALLGSSGCGKTTLLRLLSGFEQPTSGRILIGGVDMSTVPPNLRPVNMMFQSYALFPHMTVEKNIGFGLKQEGKSKAEIKQRVDEMLRLVQLEKFAQRKPHQLSGGQKQRVALARSLAKGPKLLLLDEPLGALDKKLREQTQFELMNLQESLGLTFVIVTHDQEEAMTVASRIAVMDKGEVLQVDVPAEIYEQPTSRFVADFIGNVNIHECSVKTITSLDGGGQELRLDAGGLGEIRVRQDVARPVAVGAKVWFAIRPEKVGISKQPPESDAERELDAVSGKVLDIAYSGDTSTYHVQLADGTVFKAQTANQRRLRNRAITWEDEVWLSWSTTAAVVLTD
ncbi:MAG: ABC transporter ATP-binding protein [Thiolinea sp.]